MQKNCCDRSYIIKIKFFVLFILFLVFSLTSYAQSYRDFELARIKFQGNDSFAESQLKSILASKETPWWFWKFLDSFTSFGEEPVYFDSSKIRIDKMAIESFYKANGFFHIVTNHEVKADSSARTVELTYILEEGRTSNYGMLELIGLDQMPSFIFDDMVSKNITLDSSKRYFQEEVQSNIYGIVRYLADNGYLFSQYDSTIVTMDTSVDRTDIEIYFSLGNRYSVNEVRIDKSGIGADDVSYDLIEEISGIKPSQVYSQQQLDRSQFRLFRTGLFTSLDIDPVVSEASSNLVPILITARIGTMNEISPEIKADNQNNSFNTGVGIDFIRKNFLGDARRLTLSLSTRVIDLPNFNFRNIFRSEEERDDSYQGDIEAVLRLEQPFLFGRPILSTTEGYYRGLTISSLSGIEYGASQKFDFEMPQYTFITLMRPSLNIDFINYTTEQNSPNQSINIKSTTPGISVELGSTKTDDLFFPSEGYSLLFNPEINQSRTTLTLSGEEIQNIFGTDEVKTAETAYFYRIQTSFAQYFGLSKNKFSVLAVKLKTGYIQTISGRDELIPPNKTFFAGGSNSVRGWRSRELIPAEDISYFGLNLENQPRGGTFLIEGSFELRQKLAESFGFAVFSDYGNSWNSYQNITFSQFAVTTGFGLRIYTPIAPFRLDFGVKFFDPADQKMIFGKKLRSNLEIHFGIGEAF